MTALPPSCPCPLCMRRELAAMKEAEREYIWAICAFRDATHRRVQLDQEEADRVRRALIPRFPTRHYAEEPAPPAADSDTARS